jgi:hypothetical protein
MDSFGGRRETTVKLILAALFLCTAGSITCALAKDPNGLYGTTGEQLARAAALTSPFAFLCASILVFRRPRLGYAFALAGGLLASPWLAYTELSLPSGVNSWIALNLADGLSRGERDFLAFVKLKLLSVVLIAIATLWSAVRLLPSCRRTWPVFAVSGLLLAIWFLASVTPYRIPIISDGVPPELRVLHVEKRGLRFQETGMSAFKDGKFVVWRNDRRLFQYRFEGRVVWGPMSQAARERASALAESTRLLKLRGATARALRSWTAEGWYVVIRGSRPLAFTTENRTAPPPEVTDLFHEIDTLPAREERLWAVQDVCLGFCYDPVAALNPVGPGGLERR